ncbi:MAG: V-type ATP synthase subunit D [Oscillospiraceae bacterium]|nr:V-type ATP synthase subunit D [Oscillospiraceae bacterium]
MASRVNTTRMELTKTKKRLSTAVRGHKLLKDKQDEMARQFMYFIRRNKELRDEIEALLSKAMGQMALAEAEMGRASLEEALLVSASGDKPDCGTKNIMSVDVPSIGETETRVESLPYGFAFTSEKLDSAVLSMNELMPKLYELAAVEKTCDMLADEMERTRRRVNALEYVMIPEMRVTIKYITMKLEDNERGNLVRLMKVKEMMAKEAQ